LTAAAVFSFKDKAGSSVDKAGASL
jgi:hypothetical protein